MLVAVEEHHGARVVELVHFVEIRHLGDVHQVYGGKVLTLQQMKLYKGQFSLIILNYSGLSELRVSDPAIHGLGVH